jgi:hypothetical protein
VGRWWNEISDRESWKKVIEMRKSGWNWWYFLGFRLHRKRRWGFKAFVTCDYEVAVFCVSFVVLSFPMCRLISCGLSVLDVETRSCHA